MVCLAPQLFFLIIRMQMWDCLVTSCHLACSGPPATALTSPVLQPPPRCTSLLLQLTVSTPPTCLNKCFFFNSLVFRLPYFSIFWQFWSFFVFKFVIVILLVVGGGKVYLTTPPSWLEVSSRYLLDHFSILILSHLLSMSYTVKRSLLLETFSSVYFWNKILYCSAGTAITKTTI